MTLQELKEEIKLALAISLAQKPKGVQLSGWRNMLCVESANALDNLVTVAPGAVHALAVEYRAEPL